MNQYLFTYLNQKYGLKVNINPFRVWPLKLPTTLSQEFKSIQPKTMILRYLAKFWEMKSIRNLDSFKPNLRQQFSICLKCILNLKCHIKTQLISTKQWTNELVVKSLTNSVKTLSDIFTTKQILLKFCEKFRLHLLKDRKKNSPLIGEDPLTILWPPIEVKLNFQYFYSKC